MILVVGVNNLVIIGSAFAIFTVIKLFNKVTMIVIHVFCQVIFNPKINRPIEFQAFNHFATLIGEFHFLFVYPNAIFIIQICGNQNITIVVILISGFGIFLPNAILIIIIDFFRNPALVVVTKFIFFDAPIIAGFDSPDATVLVVIEKIDGRRKRAPSTKTFPLSKYCTAHHTGRRPSSLSTP